MYMRMSAYASMPSGVLLGLLSSSVLLPSGALMNHICELSRAVKVMVVRERAALVTYPMTEMKPRSVWSLVILWGEIWVLCCKSLTEVMAI